ncbi:piggyBac transposable element-derived protein 3-like [Gigantopelta aegis]|uniref:piggyBac transposable element-derived protein 3-like n=1 Tax=Gigantopelta aegis TaxID=1735272 RepID=UPI001B88DD15|nr:piggyBac transposable element-derived protein 3-like [Gigantopelta aegis]
MGGVDLFGRYLSDYRPSIRGKKWYFPFFTNALNVCATAAWRVHKELGGAETHLVFLRYIVRILLKQVTTKRCLGTPRSVLPDILYDGAGHNQDKTSKEGRCRLCGKNTFYRCVKCNQLLHQKCFFPYHSRA